MATKKAAPKKTARKPVRKAPAHKPAAKKASVKKAAPKRAAKKPASVKKVVPAKKAALKKPASSPAPPAEALPPPAARAAPTPEAAPPPAPPAIDLPVHVGDEAPDFTLLADDGSTTALHDLRGKKVILYFYPRDNTPGCTLEARDFSELLPEFEAKNAAVLGVSTDDEESHRHFKHTCELTVKLLADTEKKVHDAYGTWREKNMYGRTIWGTVRTTFLIDESGRIARIWPKVRTEDHALDVLNSL